MLLIDKRFETFQSEHVWVPPVESWKWAEDNIDYSRAENYDTPYKDDFSSDLIPSWKDALEDAQDRNVREQVELKCSRAGFSENLILTDLRYTVARNPEPTLYITGEMELAKGFLDRRVIRGMSLARETEKQFKGAKVVRQDIQFPAMDFRATWASSGTATKQDGWARIYADEVSLWNEFGVDMVRRRCAAYPFHHIIWGGSIDPTRRGNPDEDPMLKLYEESDKGEWYMPDPAGGEFKWTHDGVKWAQAAKGGDKWDLEEVESSAHYQTPNGTIIQESERMDYNRKGYWKYKDTGTRRGRRHVALMIPFADCSFGSIAKRFISAKYRINTSAKPKDRNRNTLRTYFAEYWAEAHRENEASATEEKLTHCQSDYKFGQVFSPGKWVSGNYVTADVQKLHIWWLAREWAFDQDRKKAHSALLECGNSPGFPDFDETIGRFEPSLVGIDIGYALRQSDVADYCAEYTDTDPKESRVIALRGSDTLKSVAMQWTARDATEGRSTGGGTNPFLEITWSADTFRSWLIDCIDSGEDWRIPNDWTNAEKEKAYYFRQILSTRKLDGEWVSKHKDDHLFDCEAMQIVLARWDMML